MRKLTVCCTVILFLFLMSLSGCVVNEDDNKAGGKKTLYVNDDGTTEYTHIQDAVDAAKNGDTVYVFSGFYNESITINKSIALLGENANNTQIILDNDHLSVLDEQYSYIPNDEVGIVHIMVDNCTLQGFTIVNNVHTEYDYDVSNVRISSSNNTITRNRIQYGKYGVFVFENVYDNVIAFNYISSNDYCGIYISFFSERNIIQNNDVFNNFYGIRIKGASYNEIYRNNITGGLDGVTLCCSATNNTMYLNSFVNNSGMSAYDSVGGNYWDYLGRGNYWDDYRIRYPNATATDGIWNIPYSITSDIVIDYFPLEKPYYLNAFRN